MRYYQQSGQLLCQDGSTIYNLTAANAELETFASIAEQAQRTGTTVDEFTRTELNGATPISDDSAAVEDRNLPVKAEEVWAAGVTYEISEQAREAESGLPDVYLDVYTAERPELFFKATPSRTVGPGQAVGIRGDSEWSVPEPELGIVIYEDEIIGYTIGNDMSSRSIEGENPLYLPQAKVYDRCCALGPCVASPSEIDDPHDLTMTMSIDRDGNTVYSGETSTAEMVRDCDELVSYLSKHNTLPKLTVLLTGTSLVPDEGFTLQPADEISITIEEIGTLTNPVTVV
jgi:2-dehydro-3-deoxy-D-arabinonate dehydratase